MGYFNAVSMPKVLDLREIGPNTTCTTIENTTTGCIPNAIPITNPYPFPISPAVVDIPNTGGFFYVGLNSGAIGGISDGAQYVHVNISDTQIDFKLTLNPYVYGLSVMKYDSGINVPLQYNSANSPTF